MECIERFDGDDDWSMAADNTSAFNCREIAGGGPYSVHSWGKPSTSIRSRTPTSRVESSCPQLVPRISIATTFAPA